MRTSDTQNYSLAIDLLEDDLDNYYRDY